MKNYTINLLLITLFLVFTSAAAKDLPINQNSQAKNLFIIVMNGVRYDDAFGEKNTCT